MAAQVTRSQIKQMANRGDRNKIDRMLAQPSMGAALCKRNSPPSSPTAIERFGSQRRDGNPSVQRLCPSELSGCCRPLGALAGEPGSERNVHPEGSLVPGSRPVG